MYGNEAWFLPQAKVSTPKDVSSAEADRRNQAQFQQPVPQTRPQPQQEYPPACPEHPTQIELLQALAWNGGGPGMGGEGNPFQRVLMDFARRSSSVTTTSTETASNSGAVAANFNFCFPPGMEPFGSVQGWWPQAVAGISGCLAGAVGDEQFVQRMEELQNYIRQQAQEYVEGQSEWNRKLAEVRSECMREFDKVRREKREVERQAREEIFRLRQRLLDAGINVAEEENGAGLTDEGSAIGGHARFSAAWTAGVGIEEHQEVHAKWVSAESRIRDLEQYIKDQSKKQASESETQGREKEKDDEIRNLNHVLVHGSLESRRMQDELQSLRLLCQQKVLFWETGAQHLVDLIDQFLSSHPSLRQCDHEDIKNSRFGRTATKLSLTLPTPGEVADVGSLRRLLKNALKSSHCRENGPKSPAKEATGDTKCPVVAKPSAETTALEEAPKDDGTKATEGESATPPPFGTTAALSDSSPSSRDTSPLRGVLHVGANSGVPTAQPLPDAKVAHLLAQLSHELRQLVVVSRQKFSASAQQHVSQQSPARSPCEDAAVAAAVPAALAQSQSDRVRIQKCTESMRSARQVIAQNIMSVEKLLRCADKDLKKHCLDVFGQEQIEVSSSPAADADASREDETQKLVPMAEDLQLLSLYGLRAAQQQLAAVLVEFLQLPQRLKTVFDLTKTLSHDAQTSEQRHLIQVEVLQRRIQTLTSNTAGGGTGGMPLTPPFESEGEPESGPK